MRLLESYYRLRPYLSRSLQVFLRRQRVRLMLPGARATWPILPTAGRPPAQWAGWPGGKPFAFVLTHDVESSAGVARCRAVMDLEEGLGFRSAFNFVPESYTVPADLREEITARGFEVGVHGLVHDGRTFRDRSTFAARAAGINRYLADWKSVGFRAPLMMHNLDWTGDLNLEYDSSTFDTDPFEPQPDGVGTVFPFVVPRSDGRGSYVELPSTMPQDFLLFVLLQERDIGTWLRKAEWIAAKGGMVLLNTHPDYMRPGGAPPAADDYPIERYADFLREMRSRYGEAFWHALPREVARHSRQLPPVADVARPASPDTRPVIWIDLDNTPHVPFFKPIIRTLEARGYRTVVTARDAFQVGQLAERMHVPCEKIGRHYGGSRIAKVWGLFWRAAQLLPTARREKPVIALSHGARSQIVVANLLGIPSVLIMDYEHARFPPFFHPAWLILPDVIHDGDIHFPPKRIRRYPGIKEDVYAPEFVPDDSLWRELGVTVDQCLVATVRPPATEAHYHNPESEPLFIAAMDLLTSRSDIHVVLLPRNTRQADWIRALCPRWFTTNRVTIPTKAVDGLNLLWHSDLVISGGGTMNREAAALGVPVYSIFRGATGAVDRYLTKTGRLVMLTTVEDVQTKIRLERRSRGGGQEAGGTLASLVDTIVSLVPPPRGART